MFNAQLGTIIALGLVGVVVVNVAVVYTMARLSDRRITAEVMKANKRLQDQMNSRVG